ncbi:MAG: hypothetical protein Fur0020_00120 [Thermodesulfovibrionia bacterium]
MRFRFFFLTILFTGLLFNNLYAQEGTYRVGINDEISIDVAGYKEFSISAVVLPDGTISYPQIGSLYVNGFTLLEIKDLIAKKLSEGYVKSPIVTVSLKKSASKVIYLYGELSGTVPYERNITATKVVVSKGVDKESHELLIKRKGSNDIKVDIKGVIEGKDKDVLLRPDDILIIKKKGTIFIQGEVKKPGAYPIREAMTVIDAITEAGGINNEGLYGDVILKRKKQNGSGYDDVMVDIKGIMKGVKENILLKPDDILIVKPNNTFIVYGEVSKPGSYVLEDNMTVGKAIAKAGGITETGLYGDVKIRRVKEDGSGYYDIKVNLRGIIEGRERDDVFLKPDDILIVEQNKKFLVQGEVLKPGEYVLEDNMTVGKAIAKAGGVGEEGMFGKIKIRRMRSDGSGYDDIDFEIRDVIGGDKGNFPILPDDIVIVEKNKTFLIYGEVQKIGEFPLTDGMTVFKAITIAGGFNKWGSPSNIKILRPREDNKEFDIIKVNVKRVIDGDASADIPLKPGDIVVVSSGIL